jgi:hypothetical protein
MGRPSEYSEERAIAICERHAEGESLRDICESEGMPGRATLYRWLAEHADFALLLQRAREELADKLGKEILEIADNTFDAKDVPVAKLKIDSRKWLAQLLLFKSVMRNAERGGVAPMAVTIQIDHEKDETTAGQYLPPPIPPMDIK